MKYLKTFEKYKLFESSGQLPKKKFPTDKVLNIIDVKNHIEKKYGIDFYDLSGDKSGGPHGKNFFTSYETKCLLVVHPDAIVYPNIKYIDLGNDPRYKNFIDDDSIVKIPDHHDSSLDDEIYKKKKQDFYDEMKKLLGDDFDKESMAQGVNFGPQSFEWANKALDLIHKEFRQHYNNGFIRLWHPKGWDEADWGHTNPDYPHKYTNYSGELVDSRKDGLYFLSDIENYINYKYGIKDDNFYKWLIKNDYIEGRYWESIVSIRVEEDGKLNRGGGQFGMEPTEDIEHMLNIIEKDFDISGSEFEIYVDHYEKVKPSY